jgi:uncharacterized protein YpbB
VNKNKQAAIAKAAEFHGTKSLKTLKENLDTDVSYGDIRMVLASMSNDL